MDSKHVAWILFLMLVGFTNSDLQKDKEECANQLVGLATCLPYVGGDAKTPTPDCCTGLKLVLQNNKRCLCILVKDRNDPSLGLKINATLALSLPTACHAPANVSTCPALLNLAPNSPDAKVFEDFANSAANAKGNSTGNGSSGEIKNDGGRGKRWLVVEMVCSVIISMVVHTSPNL